MMNLISNNEKETRAIGRALGESCQGGEIFCLSGELGSGKTTLSKGIAQGLKIKKNITSPTFIILNSYTIPKNSKIKKLIHIDAYRLKNTIELEGLGFFDLIKETNNIIIIEWGEKIKKYLPAKKITITIKNINSNKRKIIIS
ncbi:MAG: tRNA (adenosine(37)-N6)-threonylcarbamoyltransferase complex ATPase subunit type 1 TsaE [Patescibacteria group bacterium]|nr:tRNA (adenosine(37)-N6)-threonylcarbamoyltransferase complex ATPase subunit type 1 TsaE [Patescibacteria group bacterium]